MEENFTLSTFTSFSQSSYIVLLLLTIISTIQEYSESKTPIWIAFTSLKFILQVVCTCGSTAISNYYGITVS